MRNLILNFAFGPREMRYYALPKAPDPKLTKPEWFWRVCLSSYVSSVRPTDYKSHQEPFSGDYSMAAKEIELFKSQANIGFTA